jgi:hypothetical protein
MSAKVRGLVGLVVVAMIAAVFPLIHASAAEREQRPAINIQSNDQFDAAHGVRSGKGTMKDPYVISGWRLGQIRIENTDRHVVIEDNTVTGRMVLNWIGDRAHVHNNEIADLRVNQNVPRTGMPTSGEIAHNSFGLVGQLRHWDGIFEHNIVGSPDQLGSRAVNFDGFNGAHFRNNTIYGFMEARLHGHHHSSGYGEPSHQHAGEHHMEAVDHTKRYHEVWITGNTIKTNGPVALSYVDTNHAANDRTAASEREPALNEPHVHHTRVHITGNRLIGGGLLVNVFNAPDKQKHLRTARGLLELKDNLITLANDGPLTFRDYNGIEVQRAQDVTLRIAGNRIAGAPRSDGPLGLLNRGRDSGVYLHELDKADIWITDDTVSNRSYGVRAEKFTPTVHWVIRDLETHHVDQSVYTDDSVKDSPAA